MSARKGLIVERILRDPVSIRRQVVANRGRGRKTDSLLLTSLLWLPAYGAMFGASDTRPRAADAFSTLGSQVN
jgi:hypothetical protein